MATCALVRHDHRSRQRRDHRLARTHITLQEPVHRLAGIKITADIVHSPRLRTRQRERQSADPRRQPFIRDREAARFHLFPIPFLAQDSHLQEEDFIEGKAFARRLQLLLRIWKMRMQKRLPYRYHLRRGPHIFRQRIDHRRRPIRHNLVDESAQPFLA